MLSLQLKTQKALKKEPIKKRLSSGCKKHKSVCKKYYVADSLIRAYENETAFPFFKRALRKSSKSSDLQKAERQVLKLLEYAANEKLKV